MKKLGLIMLAAFLVYSGWVLPWRTVASFLCPGVVLSHGLEKRIGELYSEYIDGPVYALTSFFNRYSAYRTNWKLAYGAERSGELHMDFEADFQNAPGRVLLAGDIWLQDWKTDLAVYLDETTVALHSDAIMGECWYGVQYESLYQTLCEHPVWASVFGGRGLEFLNSLIRKAGYLLHWEQPLFPVVNLDHISQIVPAALFLDLEVKKANVQSTSGKERAVIMTCEIPVKNFMQGLPYASEHLSDAVKNLFPDDPDTVELEFLLVEGVLHSISGKLADDRISCTGDIRFGSGSDSGGIQAVIHIENLHDSTGLHVSMESGDSKENNDRRITIRTVSGEKTGTVVCSYHWDSEDRALWALLESEGRCAALYGAFSPDSVRLDTAGLGALLEIMTGWKSSFRAASLMIQKGSTIAKPEDSDVSDIGKLFE